MSTAVQLYTLKKYSFSQVVSLASLNRRPKYMAVTIWQVVFGFHISISRAMFLLHISLLEQRMFILYILFHKINIKKI